MKKFFAILVAVAALSMVMTGCNKGEEAGAGASGSPAASASPAAK